MANFINLSVIVTLHHPPNTVICGRVSHLDEQTSTLGLDNVYYPASRAHAPSCTVEGRYIADIKIDPEEHQRPAPPAYSNIPSHPLQQQTQWQQYQQSHTQAPPIQIPSRTITRQAPHGPASARIGPKDTAGATPAQQNFPAKKTFVDPAILSVGRPSSTVSTTRERNTIAVPVPTSLQEAPATPIKPLAEAASVPVPASISNKTAKGPKVSAGGAVRKENNSATLSAPFSGLDIGDGEGLDDTDEPAAQDSTVRRVSLSKTRTGKPMEDPTKPDEEWKRTRRGGKGRKKKIGQQSQMLPGQDFTPEDSKRGAPNGTLKGKGWRQTPLLQEDTARQPGVISGRVGMAAVNASNRKNRRQKALEQANGWATEDATDIQELPDFDFAQNLAKFDKSTVFDQIRNEDTTADEDRLVHFNRLARPGTNGGKNLHPTENVLDGPRVKGQSASYSDSSADDFGSGRGSRRAMSRASTKRNPQRSGSGLIPEDAPSHQAGSNLMSRTRSSLSRPIYTSSHATGSPKPGLRASPPESPFLSPLLINGFRPASLRVHGSNRTCHTITPGGMVALEEAARDEFGLTEDMMAENSARGIAEIALSALANPTSRRPTRETIPARPVIVFLIGNHRSGARAIASARHLQQRGMRVLLAILGFERDHSDWDKDIRRQDELFRAFGGIPRSWAEVESLLKKLDAPPDLIIDALLGRDREFEALGDTDRKEVLRIVGWANKSRASVLAVEGPSGIGGSTGESPTLEGEPLELRAKTIVCLGAPRTGLLRALVNGTGRQEPEWAVWVVDIGLNRPWKKAGIGAKGGVGVPFGESWVVRVGFVEAEGAEVGGVGGKH